MDLQKIYQQLNNNGQEHLLEHVKTLCEDSQKELLEQLLDIDESFFSLAKKKEACEKRKQLSPLEEDAVAGEGKYTEKGKECLKEGKVGCILVAGGQGTRLGFERAKGFYPITPFEKKTLFQYFTQRLLAAKQYADLEFLPLAVMVSQNHLKEIQDYFESCDYFGFKKEEITIFAQSTYPFLDNEGKMIATPEGVACAPRGNGDVFRAFVKAGIDKVWNNQGIEHVCFAQVDNPLADPVNLDLLGYHKEHKCDVAIQAVKRESIEEQVGLVVKEGEKTVIIEYLDATPELSSLAMLANISYFCFSLSFIQKIGNLMLPIHKVLKAIGSGKKTKAWKYEHFVFDALSYAKSVGIMLFPRSDVFAPLKEASGLAGPDAVKQALINKDQKIMSKILNKDFLSSSFELSPEFHYPTEKLLSSLDSDLSLEGYISLKK
jgi:UDP-N-acetylglucosamine/UDP-N-acetylgalactosamine diphosphorylase